MTGAGTVEWVFFHPLPRTVFVKVGEPEDGPEAHLDPKKLEKQRDTKHSVLEMTTVGGEKLILDGTPDQYDWHAGGWIIPKATAERDLMLGPAQWPKPEEKEKEKIEGSLQKSYMQELKSLYDLTQELLEELDWKRLFELEEEELQKEVGEQARRKFKNVFS
ncbi:hypothetical protein G6514_002876 [Epicoccum nigrum]|nr:hypothetical protein G6514_002876 [Epicoccum nigrum]